MGAAPACTCLRQMPGKEAPFMALMPEKSCSSDAALGIAFAYSA
jgi:hypothetical protein